MLTIVFLFTFFSLVFAYLGALTRRRRWYLLAFLVPTLWMLSPLLLVSVDEPGIWFFERIIHSLRNEFDLWYWMLFLLWFMIYLIYVRYGGEGTKQYDEIIRPRRAVWSAFGGAVLGLVLITSSMLINTSEQLAGLQATRNSHIDAIEDLSSFAARLRNVAARNLSETYFNDVQVETTRVKAQAQEVAELAAILKNKNQLQAIRRSRGEKGLQTSDTFDQIVLLSSRIISVTTAAETHLVLEPWMTEDETVPPEIRNQRENLIRLTDEINDLASSLAPTTAVLKPDRIVPFLIITVLFTVFLLIPWLLYFSFILSKRSAIVQDNRTTLQDLGLLARFLESPAPPGDNQQEAARHTAENLSVAIERLEEAQRILRKKDPIKEAIGFQDAVGVAFHRMQDAMKETGVQDELTAQQEIHAAQQINMQKWADVVSDLKEWRERFSALVSAMQWANNKYEASKQLAVLFPALQRLAAPLTALQKLQAADPEAAVTNKTAALDIAHTLELARLAREEALEIVIKQRGFHSREYIIPLLILTLLTGVGWYYIFFPNALAGLVQLIVDGGSLDLFTRYLTDKFSPITATFAGAWLFVTVMLINRWVQDDLYPRSFFYGAMRIVIAFLVGILFVSWANRSDNQVVGFYNLLLAFAVGATPLEFVRAALRAVKPLLEAPAEVIDKWWNSNILQTFSPPDWGSRHPLTRLEDLTIWDDTRLFQEGIQNVHSMANADLEHLVLNTPFAPHTLIDWVDQALLHVYATDHWLPGLKAICLRTASDLLNFCWPQEADDPDPAQMEKVVTAYAYAHLKDLTSDDPRLNIQRAGKTLHSTLETLAQQVGATETLINGSGTTDLKALNIQFDTLKATLTTMDEQRTALHSQLSTLDKPDNHLIQQAAQSMEDLGATLDQTNREVTSTATTVAGLSGDQPEAVAAAMPQVSAAIETVAQLHTAGTQATEGVISATHPHRLTPNILEIILRGLNNNPNVRHARSFWRARSNAVTMSSD